MAITNAAISAADTAARAAGRHLAVGTNALRRRVANIEWSTSGLWSDSGPAGASNVTDPLYPTRHLYDGSLYTASRPDISGAAVSTLYIMLNLTAGTTDSQTIDAFVFKMLNAHLMNAAFNVRVRLANDGEFTDFTGGLPAGGLVSASGAWPHTAPIIASRLTAGATGPRFQGVQFARIELINTVNFSIPPQVTEVVLGRQRQFAHKPREPFDPTGLQSGTDDFTPKYPLVGRDVRFVGRKPLLMRWKPHTANIFGIDEYAAFRSLYSDTNGLTNPFLWIDRPLAGLYGGDGGNWCFDPNPELNAPFVNATARELEIPLLELPPFEYYDV